MIIIVMVWGYRLLLYSVLPDMERFAEPVEILNPEIWNVLKIHVANYRAKWAKI